MTVPPIGRDIFPKRPKSRFGCLGCLAQVAVILVIGGLLVLAITAVFAPWGFYLGGKFHWLPQWQGYGTMHAKGGKYVVYVYLYPTPSGQRIVPESAVRGQAYLCSPRHEIFRMTLGGSMRRGLNLNTDGETSGSTCITAQYSLSPRDTITDQGSNYADIGKIQTSSWMTTAASSATLNPMEPFIAEEVRSALTWERSFP